MMTPNIARMGRRTVSRFQRLDYQAGGVELELLCRHGRRDATWTVHLVFQNDRGISDIRLLGEVSAPADETDHVEVARIREGVERLLEEIGLSACAATA
jgi:hypothetical protein